MSCERFRSALKDAALGAPMGSAADAHVSACARCRDRLATDRRAIAALDGELKAALSVQPSAAFQAQVRMRVADAPETAAMPLRWIAVATAVAALVAVAVLRNVGPAPISSGSEHTAVVARPVELTEDRQPASPRADAPPRTAPPRRAPGGSRAVRVQVADGAPEVLVPPDRAEAIRRLVEAVAEGRLQGPRGPDALAGAAAAQPEIAPLTIPPISLSPLELRETAVPTIDGLDEGVHRD